MLDVSNRRFNQLVKQYSRMYDETGKKCEKMKDETKKRFQARVKAQEIKKKQMIKQLADNALFYDYCYELMARASQQGKGCFEHLFYCLCEKLIDKEGARIRFALGINIK